MSGSHSGHVCGSASFHAAIGRIEDHLVLPAFFTGNAELAFAFHRGGEVIHLLRIGEMVRNSLVVNHLVVTNQIDGDREVDSHTFIADQCAILAANLDCRMIFGPVGNGYVGQGAALEFSARTAAASTSLERLSFVPIAVTRVTSS